MRIAAAAVVTALTAGWSAPAFAQEYGPPAGPSTGASKVSYDPAGAVSPSSATATVSPSSVPAAMERMSDDGAAVELSLGTIIAGGKFGTGSDTDIWSSALGARLHLGDLTVSASLPWMRISSRSTIFAGIDATPVLIAPNTSPRRTVASGFGDLTLGGSYRLPLDASPVDVELSGRVKLATAGRNSRLSSGEDDYALGVDVSVPVGNVTPFASLTYRFLGDIDTYTLRDGPAASAGATYAIGEGALVVASYHYSRAATRLIDDGHELFVGASTSLPRTSLRLTGFTTAGLSRGAPAASAGLALSVGLWKRRGR